MRCAASPSGAASRCPQRQRLVGRHLVLRLRGALAAVNAAITRLGGELIEPGHATSFWHGLRHHEDEFFTKAVAAVEGGARLWRLSVPADHAAAGRRRAAHRMGRRAALVCSAAPAVGARGRGACRRPRHAVPRRQERRRLRAAEAPLDRIHRELKKAFDPSGVFNPGRMYPGF